VKNEKSAVRSNVVPITRGRGRKKPPASRASRASPSTEGVTRTLQFPQAGTAAAYAAFVVHLAAANRVPLGLVCNGREIEMILTQLPGNDDEPAVTDTLLKTASAGS
jgi:hypothetical protein